MRFTRPYSEIQTIDLSASSMQSVIGPPKIIRQFKTCWTGIRDAESFEETLYRSYLASFYIQRYGA